MLLRFGIGIGVAFSLLLVTPARKEGEALLKPAPSADGTCDAGTPSVQTTLYFGFDRKDAAPVTQDEWQTFVDTVVTPLFKDGSTVISADGEYLGQDGTLVKEPSRVLILFHDGSAGRSHDVDSIRDAYKKQFAQEAVLRIDDDVCFDL